MPVFVIYTYAEDDIGPDLFGPFTGDQAMDDAIEWCEMKKHEMKWNGRFHIVESEKVSQNPMTFGDIVMDYVI